VIASAPLLAAVSLGAATLAALVCRLAGSRRKQSRSAASLDVHAPFGAVETQTARREVQFNRRLIEVTWQQVSQGIGVVDREDRLVAWNKRYQEIMRFPANYLYVGIPVATLVDYSNRMGWTADGFGPTDRLKVATTTSTTASLQLRDLVAPDGRVLQVRRDSIADGGYLFSLTDVTDHKKVERALRAINKSLEERVAERTKALESAVAKAEQAQALQSRFLAAATHDLMQPLYAARLLVGAIETPAVGAAHAETVARVGQSLDSARELLSGLIEASRLSMSRPVPQLRSVQVSDLLANIREQFAPIAEQRNLRLAVAMTDLVVRSDEVLLRRILQNFVGNALRYTATGGVLIGCRRAGRGVRFEVWDTGPGLTAEQRSKLFREFTRFGTVSPWGERGLGLGLAICDQIAVSLGHTIDVRSTLHRGSVFSVQVARAFAGTETAMAPMHELPARTAELAGLQVLCVEDDPFVRAAVRALLSNWGCKVVVAESSIQAELIVAEQPPDVILCDMHLGDLGHGLDVLRRTCSPAEDAPVGLLITADSSPELHQEVARAGFQLLQKPVTPDELRKILTSIAANRGVRAS
jgi:signal transduction histidine kinase/CheY-like chemotaxis protein